MYKAVGSKWLSKPSNRFYILALIILPITFIYLGFLLKSEIPILHLNCVDPEYAYLINGLNFAHLSLPWHIDHPGTPLQLLIAIDLRIVHLFHPGSTLDADVFMNPELYLNAIRVSLYFLHATALFFLGYFIYKKSNNLLLGLFFQLTPFLSYELLTILKRVVIEQMFIFSIIYLILVIVLYLKEVNIKPIIIDKYLILFSLIVGFCTAIKITFAPLFFIPFMLFSGIKKKALYFIFSIVSFGIFAFPIYNRWVYFRNWIGNLFVHSGRYGSGASNIVDVNSFWYNLKTIFSTDTFFPIIFFTVNIACLLYHLPFLKVKEKNDRYYKGLLGVALSMIIMVIMVAKQYSYTYLSPLMLLMLIGLYLIFSIYSRPFHFIKRRIYIVPFFLVFLYCIYFFEVKKVFYYHSAYYQNGNLMIKEMNKIESKFKNKPTLLLTYNYGEPFKEYGFYCGMVYCGGNMRNVYAATLKKMYPQIYFYNSWSNGFFRWDSTYFFVDLLKKYQKVILLVGDTVLEKTFSSKLHGINRQIDTKFKKVYSIDLTKETFYEVIYDSIAANKTVTYSCNAETLDSTGNYFINSLGQKFENGNTQSKEKAKSGRFSSKLTKEYSNGMTCFLSEVKTGEHYLLCVWKYNNNNSNAGLVVSSQDAKIFYTLQTTSKKEQGKWQKLQIDFVVPESLNNQDIKIYCRNNDKDLPAYFDDLEIKKL